MNAPTLPTPGTPLPETLFSVPGMRCAGCIAKLESGLAAVPGVAAARVNFTAKRVTVTHAALSDAALAGAFAGLGFEAVPLADVMAADDGSESRELLRAVAVAGFAAMNVMLLSVSVWAGAAGPTRDMFHWLSAMIALPAIAYAGRPFFRSAWRAVRAGRTNMDVPITIGVGLATALSLYETITGGAHAYFDSAVMLLFFLLTGRWLDAVMRDRARDGVTALLRHTAPGALVRQGDGGTAWVKAADLRVGMVMIVAAGERLAADGEVIAGRSHCDQSLLTGESLPVQVLPGDRALAGSINIDAPLTVRITAAGAATGIADIARLMESAGQSRSRYVRIADRAARLYAPAVHGLALMSLIGWLAAGAGWHQSLLIAAAVLIITCPCALGLAVPAAQIVAAGALMRGGVLVKDGSALERLAEADAVVFDKTGTLTLGRPQPLDLAALAMADKSLALALAEHSRHPLSMALRRALTAEAVVPAPVSDVAEVAGMGVSGVWQGQKVALARPAADAADGLACVLTVGDAPPRLLRFADPLRPDAAATVARLSAMGLPASILSGDRAAAVVPVADVLGLPARAGLSPQDKLAAIGEMTMAGARVLMVGDGLNDGPALAAGHVAMAPATASDASQNAADAVFLGDSLAPVAIAVGVARATARIVRQNFAAAIAYNVVAVPLAIAGQVTPLVAAVAMSGSSILVVANALRLRSAAR
ncbi:heavy metal translocating P-type ATPase [Polymorphobacter fuscus]|uniref:Cadmium-translocating P-type ATPase n=1 Tax=Sandarakinorhabdus fusca TaxID=1439888 RepID=A0A7C9GMS4_9SPHN|nr:heavy metal translocating P-type ATPase [Polymorphobacter fuscus]KAB7648673.1 cadmium-translocating P-type ATPase [Polymorphobacter fuscus]MQT16232.1 cadmium-translocating P-type ATPase [Polymorphobacter fuscus]NJC07483.1 Cu2+-exporting ATPase [Polymorphobacter fuscus]